ncbi:MAG: hypothetical protein QOH42_2281 [Blastocatellia bacterium]|nr:hypothetical protein [Blastocatellia bacterium]
MRLRENIKGRVRSMSMKKFVYEAPSLFDREEIPPGVRRRIYFSCLCPGVRGDGEQGKHDRERTVMRPRPKDALS